MFFQRSFYNLQLTFISKIHDTSMILEKNKFPESALEFNTSLRLYKATIPLSEFTCASDTSGSDLADIQQEQFQRPARIMAKFQSSVL